MLYHQYVFGSFKCQFYVKIWQKTKNRLYAKNNNLRTGL